MGRVSTGRFGLIILAVTVGALLALWVVQTALTNDVRASNLPLAARIAPNHPEVVMKQAMIEFQTMRGMTEETYRRIMVTAARAPLSYEPPLFHGIRLLSQGRAAESGPFLEEARRRNPRARFVRLALLDHYLRSGAIQQAAVEARVLIRLIPDSQRVLLPELMRLARDPETRPSLARALAGDPIVKPLLTGLAQSNAPPALVIDLARRTNMLETANPNSRWKSELLRAMIERGEIGPAKSLWSSFAGLGPDRPEGAIHDSDFAGLPGGPPFGWRLAAVPSGFAEYGDGPALVTEYYGRSRVELAAQLLTLTPGRYRLTFAASGESRPNGGRLAWKIACLGSNRIVLDMPIVNLAADFAPRNAAFAIPPDCGAQWLRLVGEPAEFPADQSASFRNLRVEPAGSAP